MVNINISIRKEAYDFLRSFKTKEKSFSDVILEFKENGSNKSNVMRLFGALKNYNIDWEEKEKRMKEFRDSFNRRMEKTAKEMEKYRR